MRLYFSCLVSIELKEKSWYVDLEGGTVPVTVTLGQLRNKRALIASLEDDKGIRVVMCMADFRSTSCGARTDDQVSWEGSWNTHHARQVCLKYYSGKDC